MKAHLEAAQLSAHLNLKNGLLPSGSWIIRSGEKKRPPPTPPDQTHPDRLGKEWSCTRVADHHLLLRHHRAVHLGLPPTCWLYPVQGIRLRQQMGAEILLVLHSPSHVCPDDVWLFFLICTKAPCTGRWQVWPSHSYFPVLPRIIFLTLCDLMNKLGF